MFLASGVFSTLVWDEGKDEPMKNVLNLKALAASRQALIFEPNTQRVTALEELAEQLAGSSPYAATRRTLQRIFSNRPFE